MSRLHRLSSGRLAGLLATGVVALSALASGQPGHSQPAQGQPVPHDTGRVETPASALAFAPFARRAGDRLVIAHYFPSFSVVGGTMGPNGDYYDQQFLKTSGENFKYRAGRGYIRERPMIPAGGVANDDAGWSVDVARAARIGIDAFGIDLLDLDGRHWHSAMGVMQAAERCGCGFKVAPEPDMMTLQTIPADRLVQALLTFAKSPAGLRLGDGRLVVIPFAAEQVAPDYWQAVIAGMAQAGQPIALIPDYVNQRNAAALARLTWAGARWGSRDTGAGHTQNDLATSLRTTTQPRWLATLAPQDMRPKGLTFNEAQGSGALASAFDAAMAGHAQGLHLVTWNDYSEGSELEPSTATHHAYYDLLAWYIAWFKGGRPPAIARDGFVVFQRNQVFNPQDTSRGDPWRDVGAAPLANVVNVVLWLRAPTDVTVAVGGNNRTFHLPAGFQSVNVPAVVGAVSVRLQRGTQVVAQCQSPIAIAATADRHDPLYGGFSSLRGCN